MVTTTDSTSADSVRIGVTLTRTATDLPDGTERTSSSARSVSATLSNWAKDCSARDVFPSVGPADGQGLQ